jgi:Acyl-CoA reductase (LuxC)
VEFLRGLDSLIAYGSDDAIRALSAFAPATFVGHGHRLSVAVAQLDDAERAVDLARGAGLDVALYDQLGCLSPQCIFVLGGDRAAHDRFVEALLSALDDLDRKLPPGPLSDAEALAIRRFRDEYEWRALGGQAVAVHGTSLRWTVIDDPTVGFRPSPLHRTIVIRRLDSLKELPRALGKWLPCVESIGIGPWPADAARVAIEALGVPRVAPLGRMQEPDLGWRQGGKDPMAGIVLDHAA